MTLILSILLLLITALIAGEIMEFIGIPAVVGEIITGVVYGPAVLHLISPDAVLSGISEVSLFFIILLIGIEQSTDTLKRNIPRALLFSIASFIFPVLIMMYVSLEFLDLGITSSLLVSISIAIPSISIISVIVRSYGVDKLDAGKVIIASVIISDVIAFVLASGFSDKSHLLPEVLGILMFLLAIFLIDRLIYRNIALVNSFFSSLKAKKRGEKAIFGGIIVAGLLVSAIFEIIGITYILGAFFAGILINEFVVGADLQGILTRTLGRLDDSFFIPLFFAIAGLDMVVPSTHYLIITFILAGISAIVGGGLDLYLGKKYLKEIGGRNAMGILGGRGAIGLAIATVALNSGLIGSELFSAVIIGTVMLSLIFPAFVKVKDYRRGYINSLDN